MVRLAPRCVHPGANTLLWLVVSSMVKAWFREVRGSVAALCNNRYTTGFTFYVLHLEKALMLANAYLMDE